MLHRLRFGRAIIMLCSFQGAIAAILSSDMYPFGNPDGTLGVANLLLLLNQILE
jgi:hypothetical protein